MTGQLQGKEENREPSIGMFLSYYSLYLTELIGLAGFDFIVIDNEHGSFTDNELINTIITAENVGLTPIVRCSYDPSSIQKALDFGSKGIQSPMVNTKGDVELIMKKTKFPPIGDRGISYSIRSSKYGLNKGIKYLEKQNKEVLSVIQIETAESIENFEEIIEVPEIDIIFFGAVDLSNRLGFFEKGPNDPRVKNIINDLSKKVKDKNLGVGTVVSNKEALTDAIKNGFDYICVPTTSLILNSLKEVIDGKRQFK